MGINNTGYNSAALHMAKSQEVTLQSPKFEIVYVCKIRVTSLSHVFVCMCVLYFKLTEISSW